MKTYILLFSLLLICILYSGFKAAPPEVPFPSGYREWAHVKSAIVGPNGPAAP